MKGYGGMRGELVLLALAVVALGLAETRPADAWMRRGGSTYSGGLWDRKPEYEGGKGRSESKRRGEMRMSAVSQMTLGEQATYDYAEKSGCKNQRSEQAGFQ